MLTRAARYNLAALGSATVGYLVLVIAANLENWQFYALRSLVTGQTVQSEIVAHPAGRWVVPALPAVFVGG